MKNKKGLNPMELLVWIAVISVGAIVVIAIFVPLMKNFGKGANQCDGTCVATASDCNVQPVGIDKIPCKDGPNKICCPKAPSIS